MKFPLTLVSGGTGLVGRFIVDRLIESGHDVRVVGRIAPRPNLFIGPVEFIQGTLEPEADWDEAFKGVTNFVHAAFDHVPGHYRGGEGDDPQGFRERNINGSLAMFHAARKAGVARSVFLSSRAVYGTQPPGMVLTEATRPHPDTLYGDVKLALERRLSVLNLEGEFAALSLRITGVYGATAKGQAADKWAGLIHDWMAGRRIQTHGGTEVHGFDVARAVELALTAPEAAVSGKVFNVSDLWVDRNDILAIARELTHIDHPLPPLADVSRANIMSCEPLHALGWRPGGSRLLQESVRVLVNHVLAQMRGR